MSLLWCRSPWVVVLLAVLNSYVRVALLVFEVSAGLSIILLVVAVRPGAFFLEEVVPLGVGPSSGALLGLVLTSGLLILGRPCVVGIDFGLTSVQQALSLTNLLGLLLEALLDDSVVLLLDHVRNLVVPRFGSWLLASHPVGV